MIPFYHNPSQVIGRATRVTKEAGVLRARVEIATAGEGVLWRLAESAGPMVHAGFLSAGVHRPYGRVT